MKYFFAHIAGEAKPDITKLSGWDLGLVRVQVCRHEFSLDSIILDFLESPKLASQIASQMNCL